MSRTKSRGEEGPEGMSVEEEGSKEPRRLAFRVRASLNAPVLSRRSLTLLVFCPLSLTLED
jgi:hypothetical protein